MDQSTLLTTWQNVAQAISNLSQTYLNVQGAQSYPNISAATLVQAKAGRVAMVSVTTAGSTVGTIYDANATASVSNKVWVIPNTVGVVFVNMPVTSGIVVVPGTGQVVTISYSAAS